MSIQDPEETLVFLLESYWIPVDPFFSRAYEVTLGRGAWSPFDEKTDHQRLLDPPRGREIS